MLQVAYYINENLGPYFCQAKKSALNIWNKARPYFQRLGENVIHLWRDLVAWCETYLPPLRDYIYKQMVWASKWVQTTVEGVMN